MSALIRYPSIANAFDAFDQALKKLDTKAFTGNAVLSNGGNPRSPMLNNVPAFTMDWKSKGETSQNFGKAFMQGTTIVRIYTQIPTNDPFLGEKQALSVYQQARKALLDDPLKHGVVRLSEEGAFSEPIPERPDIFCFRFDLRTVLHGN